MLDALDGQRVLGPDIEEPLLRADGVAADDHALDDVEGIALQHGAVHEGAGIALIAVADDEAGGVRLLAGQGPLGARQEPTAATAPQARLGQLGDHPVGIAPGEHVRQGLEAVEVDVLIEAVGIHHPRVPQGDAALAVEEGHVAIALQELEGDGLLPRLQMLYDFAPHHVALDQGDQVLFRGDLVEHLLGAGQDERGRRAT